MDRKLAGILAMVTVASTVLSFLFFEIGAEDEIQVVINAFPANLPRGGYGRPRFVLDLMANGDLPDLMVEYSILRKTHPALVKPWNQTNAADWGPGELFGNIPLLMETQAWFERCFEDGLDLPVLISKMPLEYNGSQATLYVFDYTDAYRALGLGLGQLNTTDTVWAIVVGGSGNVSTFSGIRDFFFDRLGIMYSLEISDGKGNRSFASPRMPTELRGEKPGMGLAPSIGSVHIRDLQEGDRIHVVFELMAERIFQHQGMIQLINIWTGQERMMLVNVMGSTSNT